jgi:Flp pilus assembly protein TadG
MFFKAMKKSCARKYPARSLLKNQDGVSAMEFALLFPLLFSLLASIYDLGQGIVLNQKVNTASQVIGDLVTRFEVVDTTILADVINAGELSLYPYSLNSFRYNVTSVEFDEDGDPFVIWEYTDGGGLDAGVINTATGLGDEGEGVVIVSVNYVYEPLFTNFAINDITMTERAYLRGRKSMTVTCTDCP